MPLSIFLGRALIERHTTTHSDGSVSVTVVEHESIWTEADREVVYAGYQDEVERCSQHGGPLSECAEPPDLWPVRRVCWIAAAQTVADRQRREETENAKPDAAGYLPTDGEEIYLSRNDPDLEGGDLSGYTP